MITTNYWAEDTTFPGDLDAGWLAVKPDIFKPNSNSDSSSRLKPNIHVCWNDAERKFCITFNEHCRVKSDTQQRCSFSAVLSLEELKLAHQNFANLNTDLEFSFPTLPADCWSEYLCSRVIAKPEDFADTNTWRNYFWGYVATNYDSHVMDKLSIEIEQYLTFVYPKCSHFVFMSTLFPEEFGFDEYFDNMSELRHKIYVEKLRSSKTNFESLLKIRHDLRSKRGPRKSNEKNYSAVGELRNYFFNQLRQAVAEIQELQAEYYTYLKRPFLDLREISGEKLRYCRRMLQSADVGDRIKDAMREKIPKWQNEFRDSVENLRELQIQFYGDSRKLLSDYLEALRKEARLPLGDIDSAELTSEIRDIEKMVSFENINFWTSVLIPLRSERKRLLRSVTSLDPCSKNLSITLERLEKDIFTVQSQYMINNIRLLQEKDKYLKLQLAEIRKNAEIITDKGLEDEEGDTFYDAVESEYELQKFLELYSTSQPKIHSMKMDLELIHRSLATFRTKKAKLEAKMNDGKLLSSIAIGDNISDLKKVLDSENQRKASIVTNKLKQDRETTIQRIKDYRTKSLQTRRKPITPKTSTQSQQQVIGNLAAKECNGELKPASKANLPTNVNFGNVPDAALLMEKPIQTSIALTGLIPVPPPPPPPFGSIVGIPVPPPPPPPPPPPLNLALNSKIISKIKPDEQRIGSLVNANKIGNCSTMQSVIDAIKSGSVRLKKVDREISPVNGPNAKNISRATDTGSKLLLEMMTKIKKAAAVSDSDTDEENTASDFDD